MKIFISWSGELSRKIAEALKTWIPCIIQSVEVFFSSEDIEKGDNWDKTISKELSECSYGIVCLTSGNAAAPWINFEAGAIAKTLDSKVTALMIDVKPSDIKGPLSRYQATKFEKDDFFQLITSINSSLETPLESIVLKNTFEAMWTCLEQTVNSVIEAFSKNKDAKPGGNVNEDQDKNDPIEEILQLLRKQNSLLSRPEQILPIDYMEFLFAKHIEKNREFELDKEFFIEEILQYLNYVLRQMENLPNHSIAFEFLQMFKLEELLRIISHNLKGKNEKIYYSIIHDLERQYKEIINKKRNAIVHISNEALGE